MNTNRELREHLATCKSDHPSTQLEQLNLLLIEVPTAFDKSVERLNLNLLRDIQNAAHGMLESHPDLYNKLVEIKQLVFQLRNGLIDRNAFIKPISDLQVTIEVAAKREQLLSNLAADASNWTIEQIEAFENLRKAFHLA